MVPLVGGERDRAIPTFGDLETSDLDEIPRRVFRIGHCEGDMAYLSDQMHHDVSLSNDCAETLDRLGCRLSQQGLIDATMKAEAPRSR